MTRTGRENKRRIKDTAKRQVKRKLVDNIAASAEAEEFPSVIITPMSIPAGEGYDKI